MPKSTLIAIQEVCDSRGIASRGRHVRMPCPSSPCPRADGACFERVFSAAVSLVRAELLPGAFPVNHSVNSRFLAQKWRVTRPERWGGALMGMADYTNRVWESVLRRGVVGPCGTRSEPHRLAGALPVGCGKLIIFKGLAGRIQSLRKGD
jgi:hypothetical protein